LVKWTTVKSAVIVIAAHTKLAVLPAASILGILLRPVDSLIYFVLHAVGHYVLHFVLNAS